MNTIKRAVLYARVSSDDRGKEGRNLAGQLEMCRDFALDNGGQVIAELAEDDRGASGASFESPELHHARDMAQKGEFDVLVVREFDRLSRKLAKQLIVEEHESSGRRSCLCTSQLRELAGRAFEQTYSCDYR